MDERHGFSGSSSGYRGREHRAVIGHGIELSRSDSVELRVCHDDWRDGDCDVDVSGCWDIDFGAGQLGSQGKFDGGQNGHRSGCHRWCHWINVVDGTINCKAAFISKRREWENDVLVASLCKKSANMARPSAIRSDPLIFLSSLAI